MKPLQQNSSPQEADEDAEAILPPSMLSPSAETESYLNSPLQSPRTAGVPYFSRMGSFSETSSYFTAGELVSSPLHPPTISPLMSPTLSSTSQTSLNGVHSHKKVPSIDPATPLAPRKPSTPLTLVTADGLADMIEEMQTELAAYDATLARMVSSGWSSPQEIRNVELQREEHARTWQQRVAESKKILEGTRRIEVKHEATSSVSSLNSAST